MADSDPRPDDAPKAGSTLDLSTGKAPPRQKRKGPPPVVQQTINLSTKTAEAPKDAVKAQTPATSKSSKPKTGKDRGGRSKRRSTPAAASSSLADLLDPDVLAKLRGDD